MTEDVLRAAIDKLPPSEDLIDYIEVNPAQLEYVLAKVTLVTTQGSHLWNDLPVIPEVSIPYGVCKIHRNSGVVIESDLKSKAEEADDNTSRTGRDNQPDGSGDTSESE